MRHVCTSMHAHIHTHGVKILPTTAEKTSNFKKNEIFRRLNVFFPGFWFWQNIFPIINMISVENLENTQKYKDENKNHPTIQRYIVVSLPPIII